MPDSKVVDLRVTNQDILLLTEDAKFYFQGVNTDGKFGDLSGDDGFTYRSRPNEDTETIVDFDMGHNFH